MEDFDGYQALSIREQIDGQWYVTRVYYYDGYIRELFCAEDAALSPQDGEKIIHAESLHFHMDEGLLTATLDNQVFYLYLQGKEGGRI